jgi:hypothetical protein
MTFIKSFSVLYVTLKLKPRLNQEVLDAELLATFKALSEALKSINSGPYNYVKDIKVYIYTDSQAAI